MEFGYIEFKEGTYFGTIENGMANGYGTMNYFNGDKYIGEWVNNTQTGLGVKITSVFTSTGSFVNGLRQGKCTTTEHINVPGLGDKIQFYIGYYENNLRNGFGINVNHNGRNIYYGNFMNNKANGRGYLADYVNLRSGSFTEGTYVNGALQSYVSSQVSTFPNENIFYGNCNPRLNHYWGYGALVPPGPYPVVYVGYFNEMEGDRIRYNFRGTKVFVDSYAHISVEEGDWGNNSQIKDGKNYAKIYKSGSMYLGGYSLNKRSGDGVYYDKEVGILSIRKNGVKYNISSVNYIKIIKSFETISVYDNGEMFVERTSYKDNRKISFSRYQGTLNNGVSSSYVNNPSTNSDIASKIANVSSVSKTNNSPTQSKTNEEEEIYMRPRVHDYGDGYGETLTFMQRLRLQLESNREMRLAKKLAKENKQVESLSNKVEERKVVPNKNITKLNEDYEFVNTPNVRGTLKKLKVSKEIHNIPPTVTCVEQGVFKDNEEVKEVIFSSSSDISFQGQDFKDCVNLEVVDFSKTKVKYFPKEMFSGCENLKTIYIPRNDEITIEDDSVFERCDNLEIKYKHKNKNYTPSEFISKCKEEALIRNETPEEREARLEKEFKVQTKKWEDDLGFVIKKDGSDLVLVKVTKKDDKIEIPSSVNLIKVDAFDLVKHSVKHIILPKSILRLKPKQFEGFTSLETFTSESGLLIPEYCFYNCKNLVSVEFKNKTSVVGDYAFGNCEKLRGFDTTQLTYLGEGAFYNCKSIIAIHAKFLDRIGGRCFVGCDKLQNITVGIRCHISKSHFSTNRVIKEEKYEKYLYKRVVLQEHHNEEKMKKFYEQINERLIFVKKQHADNAQAIVEYVGSKGVLKGYKDKKESIIIPVGVNEIDSKACDQLKNVVKEISIREEANPYGKCVLSEGQFEGFSQLEIINTPYIALPERAFKDCEKLKYCYFNVDGKVSENAFENCSSLYTINLGIKATSIESYAFKNCKKLYEVRAYNVNKIQQDAFAYCEALSKVYVSDKCEIDKEAFPSYRRVKVTKEIINAQVENRYESVRVKYISLLPKAIKDDEFIIKENTQYGKYLYIYGRIKSRYNFKVKKQGRVIICKDSALGHNAIKVLKANGLCVALGSINKKGEYEGTFQNIVSLRTVYLSKSTFENEIIDKNTFRGCKKLKKIILPTQGIYQIKEFAFYDCVSLKELFAPSVERVEFDAFTNCNSLKTLNLPNATYVRVNSNFPKNLKTLIVKKGCRIDNIRYLNKNTKVIYK